MSQPLLSIEDLRIEFGGTTAVDGLSFAVGEGQTVGLVGESGCGKSVTALATLGLLPSPGRVTAGRIRYAGEVLTDLPERRLRALRGSEIALISQDPLAALNPAYTVGAQVAEAVRVHQVVSKRAAREQAVEALEEVGLPSPAQRAHDFPHQLSGGQRQRVLIAMGLVGRPRLLLADEPTTALDVSVQAQILDLLRQLRDEYEMSLLLITHDLGVVAEMCDRVVVMRHGRKVEENTCRELFKSPREPYTKGLLGAVPRLDDQRRRLATLEELADG